MTRKDAEKILINAESKKEFKKYHYKKGYCCYQDDNLSRFDLIEIGSNSGIYGWNWTLYFNEDTRTFYCSCYRNSPYHEF